MFCVSILIPAFGGSSPPAPASQSRLLRLTRGTCENARYSRQLERYPVVSEVHISVFSASPKRNSVRSLCFAIFNIRADSPETRFELSGDWFEIQVRGWSLRIFDHRRMYSTIGDREQMARRVTVDREFRRNAHGRRAKLATFRTFTWAWARTTRSSSSGSFLTIVSTMRWCSRPGTSVSFVLAKYRPK
jgi:hypothetical protein